MQRPSFFSWGGLATPRTTALQPHGLEHAALLVIEALATRVALRIKILLQPVQQHMNDTLRATRCT